MFMPARVKDKIPLDPLHLDLLLHRNKNYAAFSYGNSLSQEKVFEPRWGLALFKKDIPMTRTNIFIVATLSSFVAGSAVAQTAFNAGNAAGDSFEDLQEDITDDAERDLRDFGNVGRQLGFDGSIAFRGTLQNGNTDSLDMGLGTNLSYYDGQNGYELNLVYTYGETNGSKTEEGVTYGLEYNRDLTDRLFGYAQIQGSNDEFAGVTNDTFVGLGLGYRVVDTNTQQWSIQGGPGYRTANLFGSTSGFEEAAFSIGSAYSISLNNAAVITMDTDIISSDADTVVFNDIAVSVALSDALALRTSLLTEFHTDPAPGFDDTDNTLGMAIVYNFN